MIMVTKILKRNHSSFQRILKCPQFIWLLHPTWMLKQWWSVSLSCSNSKCKYFSYLKKWTVVERELSSSQKNLNSNNLVRVKALTNMWLQDGKQHDFPTKTPDDNFLPSAKRLDSRKRSIMNSYIENVWLEKKERCFYSIQLWYHQINAFTWEEVYSALFEDGILLLDELSEVIQWTLQQINTKDRKHKCLINSCIWNC